MEDVAANKTPAKADRSTGKKVDYGIKGRSKKQLQTIYSFWKQQWHILTHHAVAKEIN